MRTTPEAIDLQRTFREMLDGGDQACAMEISSHALELRRADGIHVAVAVFTNLTQDHLDFHETMDDYFDAKRRLFASPLTDVRVANLDDVYGRRLADEFAGTVTFAIDAPADYRATGVRTGFAGTDCTFETPDGAFDVHVPLPGRFNVLNALGAWAAARALGAQPDVLAAALPDAERVPGRFEPVDEGQPFAVLVDYAHTPDSLENVLRAAHELAEARVIAVFGAGGDRDRGKRPLMGEIGARLADVCLVTSDNPRSEDPEAIIARDPRGRWRGCRPRRTRRRPPREHPPRGRACAAGRRRRDRRQGPRAGAGVRRRAQGAVRRRRGRAGGAALVKGWDAERVAAAAGAQLVRSRGGGPERAVIDSRAVRAGRPVRRPDRRERGRRPVRRRGAGGRRLGRAGGAVVGGRTRRGGRGAHRGRPAGGARRARPGVAAIARRGRDRGHRLGRQDLHQGPVAALIAPHRAVVASRGNFNTDIGMPLEILAAPDGTEVLVLEAAMRGFGEIATLAAICEPDVGVITNIGPVHLEQVGSLEGVARAKGRAAGGHARRDHGGRPGR